MIDSSVTQQTSSDRFYSPGEEVSHPIHGKGVILQVQIAGMLLVNFLVKNELLRIHKNELS